MEIALGDVLSAAAGKSVEQRLLLSRLLTRSGDQAWDFAVPLTLVKAFPDAMQIAAVYYLCIRSGQALLAPRVGRLIDRWQRPSVIRCGIALQTVAMLLASATFLAMTGLGVRASMADPRFLPLFATLTGFGLLSSLGGLMMEIAVANDIVPAVIAKDRLAAVNGRLKQIDLATEMGAPVVAGLLLTLAWPAAPFGGFLLVALWNVLSFFPEYLLVRAALRSSPLLQRKTLQAKASVDEALLARLSRGWRHFFAQPLMPAMLAYALLWLSVLSPHGVLLTAFLKGGWHLSETTIGLFRGLGASFGLVATLLYPAMTRRLGVLGASRLFIVFQAICLGAALFFFGGSEAEQLMFLALILLSRIGLYGFDLGETQLRQTGIPENVRGEVNGFASALTSLATLGLYGAGAAFASPKDFHVLVLTSVACVGLGAFLFAVWSVRETSSVPVAP